MKPSPFYNRAIKCFFPLAFLDVGDRRADAEDPEHPGLHPETRHGQEAAHGPRGGDRVRPFFYNPEYSGVQCKTITTWSLFYSAYSFFSDQL